MEVLHNVVNFLVVLYETDIHLVNGPLTDSVRQFLHLFLLFLKALLYDLMLIDLERCIVELRN